MNDVPIILLELPSLPLPYLASPSNCSRCVSVFSFVFTARGVSAVILAA